MGRMHVRVRACVREGAEVLTLLRVALRRRPITITAPSPHPVRFALAPSTNHRLVEGGKT